MGRNDQARGNMFGSVHEEPAAGLSKKTVVRSTGCRLGLMQQNKDFMEAELNAMAGWVDLTDKS